MLSDNSSSSMSAAKSRRRLKTSWGSGHSGENSGRTAILEDGADFQALTFNSVDLQFQELRGFQVIEIARALGVPPMLLMDFGRATWGNSEQMAQAFLTFTILPRMRLWAGAVSRLMPADEQEKFVPEFLVDELVKAEIAARFEAYAKAITNRPMAQQQGGHRHEQDYPSPTRDWNGWMADRGGVGGLKSYCPWGHGPVGAIRRKISKFNRKSPRGGGGV
jgi:phage portal protein BeeE